MNDDLWMFCDLETTGSEEADSIIEIGCVLTTPTLTEIGEFSSVVHAPDAALGRLYRNDFVRQMHTANGLLDLATRVEPGQHSRLVAHQVTRWLKSAGAEKGKVVLAGSGVGHFDRKFIDREMPQLSTWLRYWCIDVGVIRRAHEAWTGQPLADQPNDRKPHRALDDARLHLEEARLWRALFVKASGN